MEKGRRGEGKERSGEKCIAQLKTILKTHKKRKRKEFKKKRTMPANSPFQLIQKVKKIGYSLSSLRARPSKCCIVNSAGCCNWNEVQSGHLKSPCSLPI